MFATHGLVPGELSGLTQPGLALSASDVAGVEGDGPLTMEEILEFPEGFLTKPRFPGESPTRLEFVREGRGLMRSGRDISGGD